jgi:hypothetical protein
MKKGEKNYLFASIRHASTSRMEKNSSVFLALPFYEIAATLIMNNHDLNFLDKKIYEHFMWRERIL